MTSMPFEFPIEQRVLTSEEYAALGYIVRGETPKLDPGKPLSTGYSFPAYRADTKEEYAVDLGIGLAKVGYAISTGGLSAAASTTLGYVTSLLS